MFFSSQAGCRRPSKRGRVLSHEQWLVSQAAGIADRIKLAANSLDQPSSNKLVSVNEAGMPSCSPGVEAVTVKVPAVPLAVSGGAVATPLASVTTTTVVAPSAKVPLAPLAGTVKVTSAPPSGWP